MNQEELTNFTSSALTEVNSKNSFSISKASTINKFTSFNDIIPIKILKKGRFPILIGHVPSKTEQFAVKLYPFIKHNINPFFLNEARFVNLKHKNVSPILDIEKEKEAIFKDISHKVSYVVMELAPYGDFYEMIASHRDLFDEKLARTYFHQLIEGLDYLHSMKIVHLDLKPHNLLLGPNFTLKITDFDQACYYKDYSIVSARGTECFRAPELAQGVCQHSEGADIYSAGIILFVFKCKGVLPYLEKGKYKGVQLFELMMKSAHLFWEKHCEIQNKGENFFDQDFKELFAAMTAYSPEERISLKQIKNSRWYRSRT